MRLQILLIALLFFALLFAFIGIFAPTGSSNSSESVINAVPVDAGIILQSDKPGELIKTMANSDYSILNDLQSFSELRKIKNLSIALDSICIINAKIASFLSSRKVSVSTHAIGKNSIDFLFILRINASEIKTAQQILAEQFSENAVVTEKKYNNTTIYSANLINSKTIETVNFAIHADMLIASESILLVEDAIRQTSALSILKSSSGLDKVYATAGQNVLANLFVNYKILPLHLSKYISNKHRKFLGSYRRFSEWAALDISIADDMVSARGFSYASPKTNDFLNIFLNQAPGEPSLQNILPANTSLFMSLNFEAFSSFLGNFTTFLQQSPDYHKFQKDLRDIKKETGIDFDKVMARIIDKEIGLAYTEIERNDIAKNAFIIVKVKDAAAAKNEMLAMLEAYARAKHKNLVKLSNNYKYDSKTEFTIYDMPYPDIMRTMFGRVFSQMEPNKFTFINNYLVFGSSFNSLALLQRENALQNTLNQSAEFSEFMSSLTNKSNIFVFSNASKSANFFLHYTDGALRNEILARIPTLYKFQTNAIQFASNKTDMFFTNVTIKLSKSAKKDVNTVWSGKLDSTVLYKPQIVINHNNNEREIFVQDLKNMVYLLNKDGKVIWNRQIDGPIIGQVTQIDYFNNKKLQYLFGTENNIYLIDRLGNYVEKYPITLPYPATNELSVFDYENNRDYRIFIACSNKKVYLFDKTGKLNDGFGFGESKSNIVTPIQYFKVGLREYIILSDRTDTYILNRKGKQEIKINGTFARAANSKFYFDNTLAGGKPAWITTNETGTVYTIDLKGNITEKTLKAYSPEHHFMYADMNADGKKEYIFADKSELDIYQSSGELIFSKSLSASVTGPASIYMFSAQAFKTGITTSDNKVHLFNSDGSYYQGFPISGAGKFSITILDRNIPGYNLIVGSTDGFIVNYNVAI
ncbi:MAG TPA: hypothetical protein DCQ31_08345 [Bacteroidales bacterium]|nr:hypothetical protein [Bacteroidales bacterium]